MIVPASTSGSGIAIRGLNVVEVLLKVALELKLLKLNLIRTMKAINPIYEEAQKNAKNSSKTLKY